jgi:hypothetical protein
MGKGLLFNLFAQGFNQFSIPGGQFDGKSNFLPMPTVTRILLVIVKVNICGTNCLQKMLLQEVMHQLAGMNRLILKAIWKVLRKKKQKTSYFQLSGFCVGGPVIEENMLCMKYVIKLHSIEERHAGAEDAIGHQLIV